MITDRIFITTSIPYVNGAPHVGFAWELVIADALARYHRLRGADVRFLTGTDDNSTKNVLAAEEAGVPTASFVRRQGERFVRLAAELGLSQDDFIHTAFDPRHAPAVGKLWRACAASGDVYASTYRGYYCSGCELFLAKGELPFGRCPEHDTAPEPIEESNHFFRLSRHQEKVAEQLSSAVVRVFPDVYHAEACGWIERGLTDFSISRPEARARGWGIAAPGSPEHRVYVWFDALANYLSALDYANDGQLLSRFWLDATRRIHVIGKNVTRFHCIYWLAILASAGLPPPTDVLVHGFLTVDGHKIGKSLGNGIDPFELLRRFGRDRLRYYLLRHFPLGRDADFSEASLIHTSNTELADQLGNLLQRVLVLLEQQTNGQVPPLGSERSALGELARDATSQASRALEAGAVDRALAAAFGFVEACNADISRRQPWKLRRRLESSPGEERAHLERELYASLADAARGLLWIAGLLAPFLPDASARITAQLGTASPAVYAPNAPSWGELGVGARAERGDVLFPRLLIERFG